MYKYDWAKDANIKKIIDNEIQICADEKTISLKSGPDEPFVIPTKGEMEIDKLRVIKENDTQKVYFPVISDLSYMVAKCKTVGAGEGANLWNGYVIDGMDDFKITITFDPKDGQKKRESMAHLAECTGTICYKSGHLDAAIDYLRASIALYPDAGAYINLAKAYERKCLCKKDFNDGIGQDILINRTIRDLCRHAETLDLKDEHKKILNISKRSALSGKRNRAAVLMDHLEPEKEA